MLGRGRAAAACLDAVISTWIARFGLPATITTDRGTQFTSGMWSNALRRHGIQHVLTSAYHPQLNGLEERFHRRLKEALKACLAGAQWPAHLPWVLLGLRAAPREDSGVSPAELTFGAPLSLPAAIIGSKERPPESFLWELTSFIPCVAPLPPQPTSTTSAPDAALLQASHVYVRSPPAAPALTPAYRGPFLVLQKEPKTFKIQLGSRTEWVTVDRLKPTALPPPRGRPPGSKSPALLPVEPEPEGGTVTVLE
jgi:transposase InsO family protein